MPTDYSSFTQYGILGIVLLWFMFRMEKKMDNTAATINDLAKVMTLNILSRGDIQQHVRDEAEAILSRTNARAHPPSQQQ